MEHHEPQKRIKRLLREFGAKAHEDTRRALLARFPYALFYRAEPDRVLVIACFHAKRDPLVSAEVELGKDLIGAEGASDHGGVLIPGSGPG
jgi:hypothetical protein